MTPSSRLVFLGSCCAVAGGPHAASLKGTPKHTQFSNKNGGVAQG